MESNHDGEQVKYTLGLDIGTSSIGYAAIDKHQKPIRAKGKHVIGVRLFQEGQTAADRRAFRTTRRRLKRRKWRLNLLNRLFDPYLSEVDPNFLPRLKQSNLSPKDDNKHFNGSTLFPDKTDAAFYRQYPTMYHLRYALMTEKRKFDIREVYLAIHHIVKYRGNFLNSATVDSFKTSNIDFTSQFDRLNELYRQVILDEPFQINMDQVDEMTNKLLDNDALKLDTQKQVAKLLPVIYNDKPIDKQYTRIATEFSKAILGYKTKLDVILNLDTQNAKDWAIRLDDEDIDEKLPALVENLDESRQEIVTIIRDLYAQVTLNAIVPKGKSLSESMVDKYNDHKDHLDLLMGLIHELGDDSAKGIKLREAYTQYVGKSDDKTLNQDDFYAAIKKNLDEDSKRSPKIQRLIEQASFMPKQRTSANGVIPHQLHQLELDRIIENQGRYYPFLKEPNPNTHKPNGGKYKLDELVAFRIPYYVGPLITKQDQEKTSGADFAWMIRKPGQGGEITPWNFDQKVDRMASANTFIRRMTTKDSYLVAEDVLPDSSLIYEKFKVLNELNMLKVNDRRLSLSQKQDLFNNLFKKQKTIRTKKLQTYIRTKWELPSVMISGLSDPDKFNSSLATYIDFRDVFGEKVDDPNRQADYEKIIEWSTVFEDRKIYQAKLNQLDWLTEPQRKALLTKRYTGWGRLSKKLLTGLKDQNGDSILDQLWKTNDNFMQIQSRDEFAKQIHDENAKQFHEANNVDDILDDAFTSPQNKKAIRQVHKVVQDVVKAVGYAPDKIAIEFTRSPQDRPQRTFSRQRQLQSTYLNVAKALMKSNLNQELKSVIDSQQTLTDKLYLYFTQLGQDMYTGKEINFDELVNYQIDHILPQAFIKDDSLDNRVLVSAPINNAKSDNVPVKKFGAKMGYFWKQLAENHLISKRKLNNLTTDPDKIGKFTAQGFIHRQLVETSQVIRLVANILGNEYGHDGTTIIEVTAKMNHQMRKDFDLIKIRDVNDYHHAMDAYLTAYVGDYLYLRYPKLRSYFVYGDFKKLKDQSLKIRNFNFLHDLTNDEAGDKIADQETGEIIWDKHESVKQLKKVYHYKFMLVSQEVYTRQDALFNQTIYPASDADKRKLIPIKNNKPVDVYGGYSGNVDAYMAIVRVHGKKEDKYKVVGVPMRAVADLKKAESKDRDNYLNAVHEVLKPQFTKKKKDRKTGEITEMMDDFDVLLGKVYYRQLIVDGNKKFMLGSSTYQYNAKQLVLSDKAMQALSKDDKLKNQDENQNLIDVYDEILWKVDRYFELYDMNGFRKKLHIGREKFIGLPIDNEFEGRKLIINGKRETLDNILNGLHANATMSNLKYLGISSPFGMLQVARGITLSSDTLIYYQSPAGLFDRKVKLSDL